MITVISDFNKRVDEIECYFTLLNNIINENGKLYFPHKQTHKTKEFDEELIKVMKANCFLLLYNLIESSVKSSITEIYDSITNSSKTYSQVKDNIKRIWIKENYKNFQNRGTEFIFTTIHNIVDDIIDISFDSEKVISGNIDGQKIRDLSDNIGFSTITHYRANNGVKLHLVKTQRNNLAHGALSFSECGRQYTFEDLEKTKKEVVIYLRGILNNIKSYIDYSAFEI